MDIIMEAAKKIKNLQKCDGILDICKQTKHYNFFIVKLYKI